MKRKNDENKMFADESEYPYPDQLPPLHDPNDSEVLMIGFSLNGDSDLADSLDPGKMKEDLNGTDDRIIDFEFSEKDQGMQLPRIQPLKMERKQPGPFDQHIFPNQIVQRKSSRSLQTNILEHIINHKIKELIKDDFVDQQIKDHNKKVEKERGLRKLKMLVGLCCGYSGSKQKKIYEYNRKMVHQALTNRNLMKKIVFETKKIKNDHQRMEYLRQIKVYSHRIKSQLISTRIQSK